MPFLLFAKDLSIKVENFIYSFFEMYGADRGINLTKDDWTLGFISKDSGGTSNSISV